jgi:uncharacterized surface protein with fasciclin (FAS1) repeats
MAKLIEMAEQAGSFKTFLSAIQQAEIAESLDVEGPLTILAPTDEAFSKLPEGTLESLDAGALKKVLMYHVLFGDVRAEDLTEIDEAPTVEGSVVAIAHQDGITVNGAQVLETDILADNGVIHAIDEVLMPAMVRHQ